MEAAVSRKPSVSPGNQFGRWTVASRAENGMGRQIRWVVKCDCGTTRIVTSDSLASGRTSSCGCWRRERALQRVMRVRVLHSPNPPYRGLGTCLIDDEEFEP